MQPVKISGKDFGDHLQHYSCFFSVSRFCSHMAGLPECCQKRRLSGDKVFFSHNDREKHILKHKHNHCQISPEDVVL